MGVTFYANNGKTLDMNHPAKQLLDRMTMCWWGLIGIPSKVSKEDALLIARSLKNYVKLQTITLKDKTGYILWKSMGYEQEDLESIKYWRKAYRFFRDSGGIKKRE